MQTETIDEESLRGRESDTGARRDSAGDRSAALVLAGLVLCFFLSGFAALLYQTAWLREFSTVFGTSELAVAAVLAAYMGGLAAGAAAAARLVTAVRRPVLVYGMLEAGIALSALAVPALLLLARMLYAATLGHQPSPPNAAAVGQPIFYLLVAFVVLAIPTGLMGATLPLLTRYAVRRDSEVGPRVALLYATNTAGAVLGTIVAAFALLPALGLSRTIGVGVLINALVFGIAAMLARHASAAGPDAAPGGGLTRGSGSARMPVGFVEACVAPLGGRGKALGGRLAESFKAQPAWILPLILVSGANAFFYEVLWTRMLAHVLGGSVYAFATMLAAFLSGIALGGGVAGKVAARRERAGPAFAATQLAIAGLSMGVYQWMGPLIPHAQTIGQLTAYAVAVLLPATVFIGATFPLAVRVLARDEREAGAATARIYAWNTAGAIAGAVLAGFVLIPALGFEGSIKTAVLVNLVLALWTAAFTMPLRWPAVAACTAAVLGVALLYHPARPQAVIASTGFPLDYPVAPRELFYSVGRSSTVLLLEEDGYYFLRTNGLPEATLPARGSVPSADAEKWLTALPVVARPDAETMLVVGFGGGVALEGVPPSVGDVDVIELEPEVIEANRVLSGKRSRDPLDDPRVHVVINDARNALRLTDKRYDVIVSQPSHPWTAGASHLFTREFVAEAKRHLNDGGAFVQWISSEFVDAPLLRSLAATVSAEFEHVRLYQPAPRILLFLASTRPLEPELALSRSGRPLNADVLHYSYLGMNGTEDLVAALALDDDGVGAFAADAPVSTDDDNRMATDSRARADGLKLADLMEVLAPHDPLLQRGSWIYARLGGDLNFDYLARRLIRLGQDARVAAMAETIPDASDRYLVSGLIYRDADRTEEAQRAFTAAVRADPGNEQARFHLIEDRLGSLSRERGPGSTDEVAGGVSRATEALMRGWGHGAARDWPALARLDNELARTEVTDAWYPEAAWLRAMWRANVTRDQERYAGDAIRLLDRALLLAPDPRLFTLRALGAMAYGDPDYIVESFRYVAATMRLRLRSGSEIPASELAAMRNNVASMTRHLKTRTSGGDPDRAAEVMADLEDLAQAIDEGLGRGGEGVGEGVEPRFSR